MKRYVRMEHATRPGSKSHPRGRLDRRRLPDPLQYYVRELGHVRVSNKQLSALCPFHDDHHPSFSASLDTGAYICFACGAQGGDVIDFHQRRYNVNFSEAAKALRAWS